MYNLSLGLVSYLACMLAFLFLLIVHYIGQHRLGRGKLFIFLVLATIVWSGLMALSQLGPSIPFEMIAVAEFLRYFIWIYVLQQASGQYQNHPYTVSTKNPLSPILVILVFTVAVLTLIFNDSLTALFDLTNSLTIHLAWMVAFSILGLMLIEHLYRNTLPEKKDRVIYLCISAGVIYIYDFFVYSDALLLQSIDYELWSARGIINILILPTLVLAAVRNPSLAPTLHISRTFVFHSTSLIGTGIYLLLMSFAGYYIKVQSGEWGVLFQATFLAAALVLLLALFFSSPLKTKLKRYLSRSFSYKYDYREEWNRFSNTLLTMDSEQSIYKRSLIALGQIVESQGATLWIREGHQYRFHTGWKSEPEQTESIAEESDLILFLKKTQDLITIKQFKNHSLSAHTQHWVTESAHSWLIIPLWNHNELFGFVHLQESIAPMDLNSEDLDLLNTVAHHISLSLSLNDTLSALQQAERFKQINQMTAFLVHDLKTLLSQLSLLVENGRIHKNNPEFVDDMMNTLEHVTRKMQRTIQQLKNPEAKDDTLFCGVSTIIENLLSEYHHPSIQISFENLLEEEIFITAREEELSSAIKHIIQNAIESIDNKEGKVKIELGRINENRIYITISDNGKGMSRSFIAERLFKPFDSTKGVSGMGLGMYQCREYIHSLNGDISVSSTEGIGTTFTITLITRYGK